MYDGRTPAVLRPGSVAEVSAIHAVGQLPDPHGIASFTVLVGPIVSVSFGWVPSPSFRVTEPRAPPLL